MSQSIFKSINPYTGKVLAETKALTPKEISEKITEAHHTFLAWKEKSFQERSELFLKLKELLLKSKNELATLMTQEMGKPISQSYLEIEKCASTISFFVAKEEEFFSPRIIKTEYSISEVRFDPLGIILAIMPWNFPFWQVMRCAIPLLLQGNVLMVKHAPNTMMVSSKLEKLFLEAGFPKGALTHFPIDVPDVEKVIADPLVRGVTLTGSTRAGKAVSELAGRHLKPAVLELGGSDPYIVLHDADIPEAVKICMDSRLTNSGQTCVAAKRFIVDEKIYDEFVRQSTAYLKTKKVGNPLDLECDIGPLARADLRDHLKDQVKNAKAKGAKVIEECPFPQSGFFHPILSLEGIGPEHPSWNEEFFGPVINFIPFKTENEAIELANATNYGLGAAVFSQDSGRAYELAKKIDSGVIAVNGAVRSDPRFPFGGVKDSGLGRELGYEGTKAFVNIKTVLVK